MTPPIDLKHCTNWLGGSKSRTDSARSVSPRCFIALIAISSITTISGCDDADVVAEGAAGGKGERGLEAVSVSLAKAEVRPVVRTVDVTGTLWGDQDITISAKVAGRVAEVFKDVGDRVAAGEVLVQLDKTDYELARRSKQLAVEELLARLGLSEFPGADFDATKVPTVRRANLQAQNAEARYNRGKQLHDQTPPLISDQDFADLATAWEVAKSGYDVELLTARSLLTEARSRQADLDIATQQLSDTTLKAPNVASPAPSPVTTTTTPKPVASSTPPSTTSPSSYGVASRLVSVGEYVREGTALYRLVADDPIKFRGYVPERFAGQIKPGQTVRLKVEAYPEPFTGVLARINPQVDPASRTFLVEAVVANPDRKLQPGAFARASVETRTESATFVPTAAVVTFAGSSKVFDVTPDGMAKEVLVEAVGQTTGDWVEVTRAGRDKKDKSPLGNVVVSGNNRLATGVPVKVETTAPSTSSSPTHSGRGPG
jgi:membrane fusion protein (multidrug efflux system)